MNVSALLCEFLIEIKTKLIFSKFPAIHHTTRKDSMFKTLGSFIQHPNKRLLFSFDFYIHL